MQKTHDIHPLLAANRSYWLGWQGSTDADAHADLVTYRSEIPTQMLNGVLRVRGLPIAEAAQIARDRLRGLPWVWWVGADSEPGTADALLAVGAKALWTVPVMAVSIKDVTPGRFPEGLTIEPVQDEATLREHVACYLAAFGRPADSLELTVERELSYAAGSAEIVRLVGRIAGRTVGTASVLIHDGVAALYYVGTDAGYRRRGIANALTAEALRIAATRGARTATLQARPAALGVYRAMGFETVAELQIFTL